jgi:NitT/TauT family transport system permease protein
LPVGIIVLLAFSAGLPLFIWPSVHILLPTVLRATGATLLRIVTAYIFSVIIAVPLALWITKSERGEKIFLPVVDVLESIPILAFFPVIILIFIKGNFLEGAAIFVLTISMLWTILFSLIGGIKLIPETINDVAKVFNIKGLFKLRTITIPAMLPELVTGSILAVAGGWNIIIVAEVLHTYISGGTTAQDLFGLGSLMVQSSAEGNTALFLIALVAMVLVIALTNIFVWQRLLRLSERYRFD